MSGRELTICMWHVREVLSAHMDLRITSISMVIKAMGGSQLLGKTGKEREGPSVES